MDTTGLAILVIVAGAIIAIAGVVMNVLVSRRLARRRDSSTRADIAIAVAVFGMVAVLFGAGYLTFVWLTQS